MNTLTKHRRTSGSNHAQETSHRAGRVGRFFGLALAVTFVAAGASGVSARLGDTATVAALDNIDCDAGELVITGSDNVRRIDTSKGLGKWVETTLYDTTDDATVLQFNQVGVTNGGGKIIATVKQGDPAESKIFQYDLATDTATFTPNPLGGGVAGAVNLFDDNFYWGGHYGEIKNPDDTTDRATVVNRFNPETGAIEESLALVRLPYVTDTDGNDVLPGGNGDFTFSSTGDMYIVASTAKQFYLYLVTKEQIDDFLKLPVADRKYIDPTILASSPTGGNALNGIAFGKDGILYISGGKGVRRWDPRTGQVSEPEVVQNGTDLASCTDPPTIEVRKDIPEPFGRQNDSDQFTMKVEGRGINFSNVATTEGTATGIQDQTVGPLLGFFGEIYSVSEVAAGTTDLGEYDTTWACIDEGHDDAPVGSGTGTTFEVQMPAIVNAKVVCTFTNTAKRAKPTVTKSSDPASGEEVQPGQEVTYFLNFDNSQGTVPATVDEIDDISGVLDNAVITSEPVVEGDGIEVGPITDGAFTIKGELAPGAKATVTYKVKVNDPPNEDFSLLNFLYEAGTDKPTKCEEPNPRCTKHPVATDPAIDLQKKSKVNDVDGSGTNTVGDTIDYSFVVTNTGDVTLKDVVVTDPLLGGEMTCPQTTLAVGEDMTCTSPKQYTLTEEDLEAGERKNTATVVGTDPTGKEVTDTDPEVVPVVGVPAIDLEKMATVEDIDKSGDNTVGDKVTYTFKVTNTGTTELTDIVLTDPLFGDDPIVCPSQTLDVGEDMICKAPSEYTLTDEDVENGEKENTANVSGKDPNGKKVTDTDKEIVPVAGNPAIKLEKFGKVNDRDGNGKNTVGDTITYSFKVTNTGNVPLKDIVVTDPLLGGTMNCPKTELAVGESMDCKALKDYVLTSIDINNGKRDNTATVVGTDPGGKKVDDKDTVVIPTTKLPSAGLDTTGMMQFALLALATGAPLALLGRRRRLAA